MQKQLRGLLAPGALVLCLAGRADGTFIFAGRTPRGALRRGRIAARRVSRKTHLPAAFPGKKVSHDRRAGVLSCAAAF